MALPKTFQDVLEAGRFLDEGRPAPGFQIAETQELATNVTFEPDALWDTPSKLRIYFKYSPQFPHPSEISSWRVEAWNEGFSPLLWVISEHQTKIFNAFSRPNHAEDAEQHILHQFKNIHSVFQAEIPQCNRYVIETGQFWTDFPEIKKQHSVDQQLISDLCYLEHHLVDFTGDFTTEEAQAVILKSILARYLFDRNHLNANASAVLFGKPDFSSIFRDTDATQRLFHWIAAQFNGDLFPFTADLDVTTRPSIKRLADFFDGEQLDTGQLSFFPYRFNIIPIELISSIYEKFVHIASVRENNETAPRVRNSDSVYYTRLSVVNLILDQTMENCDGGETVLDPTCGSGVFLVQAYRRILNAKAAKAKLSFSDISDTLTNQIFGIDVSRSAVQLTIFSLYLATLEAVSKHIGLSHFRLPPLLNNTVFVRDAQSVDILEMFRRPREKNTEFFFDYIVGNPPWTYRGKHGTKKRRDRQYVTKSQASRAEALDFLALALAISGKGTRIGMVLPAPPFFAKSRTTSAAIRSTLDQFEQATIIDLSSLQGWLFPGANMPALVLVGRPGLRSDGQFTIARIPFATWQRQTESFVISPDYIKALSKNDLLEHTYVLKAAFLGTSRDLALLKYIGQKNPKLEDCLKKYDSKVYDGIIMGTAENRTKDASHVLSLPFANPDDVSPFHINPDLPTFDHPKAQWPRSAKAFRSPILLVKEGFRGNPRPITAVSPNAIAYSDGFFGIPLHQLGERFGKALAAVMSSEFVVWYLIYTSAELGIFKRRLLLKDIRELPVPFEALRTNIQTQTRLADIYTELSQVEGDASLRSELDRLVAELYGLGIEDLWLIKEGEVRASRQWKQSPTNIYAAVSERQIEEYAYAFAYNLGKWLSGQDSLRPIAQVLKSKERSTHGIVRIVFSREEGALVETVDVSGGTSELLRQVEHSLGVRVSEQVVGIRTLRILARDEAYIVKPKFADLWSTSSALEDSDKLIADSLRLREQ